MASPAYWYTHPITGHLIYVPATVTTSNTCEPNSLFLSGHFTDRVEAGDRLDPVTGRIVKILPSK